jgi:hypothetical protein
MLLVGKALLHWVLLAKTEILLETRLTYLFYLEVELDLVVQLPSLLVELKIKVLNLYSPSDPTVPSSKICLESWVLT